MPEAPFRQHADEIEIGLPSRSNDGGNESMLYCIDKRSCSSVFTLANSTRRRAGDQLSSTGANIRHGPHHAPKIDDEPASP